MNKRMIIGIIGAILLVVGFIYFTQPNNETAGTPSNHTFGEGSSGVVLQEYGDYQCPGCGAYFTTIGQVKELYKDQITFQFSNLPLEEIHINARAAARAAEAASLQGKFWEMHDKLFETQNSWGQANDPVATFENYAAELGLDTTKFSVDYRSAEVNATINADIQQFNATGETKSTPTFFLDGKKIDPQNSVESFSELIDAAIAEKTGESVDDTTEESATEPEEDQSEQTNTDNNSSQ